MTKDFYIYVALLSSYFLTILGVVLSNKFPYSFNTSAFVGSAIWLGVIVLLIAGNIIVNKVKNYLK
jgi:hypothetical protein